jgi:iron-sulfur cluster repair protein YtfE (RIC family)
MLAEKKLLLEAARMGTWDVLHREHGEMFTKVNLLEKALIDLLQKHATDTDGTVDQQKAFLEAFEHGITLHFTVEEEALFPELKKTGKDAATLVSELLQEHRSILQKYSQITQVSPRDAEKQGILLKMLTELQAHNRKEERTVPPIITQLSFAQLGKVDQAAKRLGYPV